MPVVPPGVSRLLVHPLLDDSPAAVLREDEGVVVELMAVLHGRVVHLGAQLAGPDEAVHVAIPEAKGVAKPSDLLRRAARGPSLPPGNAYAQGSPSEGLLHGPGDHRPHAAGVPVPPHDVAEGLEPEGVSQPLQERVATPLVHQDLRNGAAHLHHAWEEPARGPSTVEREVRHTNAGGDAHAGRLHRIPTRVLAIRMAECPSSRDVYVPPVVGHPQLAKLENETRRQHKQRR